MTVTITLHEAQTYLSQLLQKVIDGEEVIITESGAPVARLIPYEQKPQARLPGSAKGKIWIAPDFNDPLPDDFWEFTSI